MKPKLNFSTFTRLIFTFFLKPGSYPSSKTSKFSVLSAFVFLSFNIFLGLLLQTTTFSFSLRRIELFFLGVSQVSIYLPIFISLYLFLSLLLFFISKALLGRAKFFDVFKAVSFSSSGIIFFSVPFLNFYVYCLTIYILTQNLFYVNNFSKLKALVNTLIPLGLVIVLRVALLRV